MKKLILPELATESILLDDDICEWAETKTWSIEWNHKDPLFYTFDENGQKLYLHRAVVKAKKGSFVRNRSGNKFDLRRSNLIISKSDDEGRKKMLGVVPYRDGFRAVVFLHGFRIYSETFLSVIEAQQEYFRLKNQIENLRKDAAEKAAQARRNMISTLVKEATAAQITEFNQSINELMEQLAQKRMLTIERENGNEEESAEK